MADEPKPLNDVIKTTQGTAETLEDILQGGHRPPPDDSDIPSIDGKFKNGHDLAAPPGGKQTLNSTTAPGGVTFNLDDTIEFLHFGTTYLDRASQFSNKDPIDDTDPKAVLPSPGGRASVYRAALERETILLAGFLQAHIDALNERDDDEGALGKAMAMVGNLLGGGGGASGKPEPADLDKYVGKVKDVVSAIDVEEITYTITHKAAIDLHDARSSYAQYLDEQNKKRGDSQPDPGLLSKLPGIGSMIPPEIGNVFTLVEKMATKAFDIYVGIILKLQQTMMPVIEKEAREVTIDALTSRRIPVFDVWHRPPPEKPEGTTLIKAPTSPGGTGIGFIDSVVNTVVGAANSVANTVDSVADPAIDFVTMPAEPTPGGKYVSRIFLQFDDGSGYLKQVNDHSLGELACTAFCESFGFEMPSFVKAIITKLCNVLADFLRGIYGTLVSADMTQSISEKSLVEAGRLNLVSQLIESLASSLGFLNTLRDKHMKMNFFGLDKTISGEAIFQRAKELIEKNLSPYLDPIIEKVMKDFSAQLESQRLAAVNADSTTMEVYLARLPSLYALLFRKTFFPVWDLLVHTVLAPVDNVVGALGDKVGGIAHAASGIVHDVGTGLLRAEKVAQTALTKGLGFQGLSSNLNQYDDALHAKLDDPGQSVVPMAAGFPFDARKTKCTGKEIDDEMREGVDKKWHDDAGTNEDPADDNPPPKKADTQAAAAPAP